MVVLARSGVLDGPRTQGWGSPSLSGRVLLGGFRLDERQEHRLQSIEVGIELAARVVTETARRPAHGEAEHRGADKALDLSCSVPRDTRFAKRPVDGISCPTSLCGRRRALEQ